MTRVTLFGGAGFLGSRIAEQCVGMGHHVCVVDGLLPYTAGRREHVAHLGPSVELRCSRIEETDDLQGLVAESDAIVDCMGWTRHRAALADPLYDQQLNLASHVHWLYRVPEGAHPRVIYLGSRGQFGNPHGDEIDEDAPQCPVDVQGIHKSAAEHHFRLAARLRGFPVVSLRLPACVGPNQPTDGEDVGLVGGFVRDLLAGRTVQVYGRGRRRAVAYADDVAAVVCRLLALPLEGFTPYNLRGEVLPIEDIATRLAALIGRGRVDVADVPHEVAAIDVGGGMLREDRLRAALGGLSRTPIDTVFAATVRYLEAALG